MPILSSSRHDLRKNKWIILVASIWLQACAGVGYAFGTYSPIIKHSLHYNQRKITTLGVAKDIGQSVGLLAGSLCDVLPTWALIILGAAQNLVGYGGLWFIVTGKIRPLPFWVTCVLICVGANGETYFNTAALVSCVRNFPRNRGPVVGILKAFAGLSGAIFTQIYAALFAPHQASFIFIVAVGPALVAVTVMSIIRPVETSLVRDNSESKSFSFVQTVCVLMAAYLMVVILLQDLLPISHQLGTMFAAGLVFFLLVPLLSAAFQSDRVETADVSSRSGEVKDDMLKDPLLHREQHGKMPIVDIETQNLNNGIGEIVSTERPEKEFARPNAVLSSESEEEKGEEVVVLPVPERKRMLSRWRSRILRAIAEGAVKVKQARGRGPRRGEDFTLGQALVKADFWLLFFSLYCGAGSGLTVIDNLGQVSQAVGYESGHIFVSLLSIWNFLGRLAGGYSSEIVARRAFPRPVMIMVAQVVMAAGLLLLATPWRGSLYGGCVLVGLGYGAHWSIVPATASELFGLKNFGMLYNFLTIANPAGSLVFSGAMAGTLYDWEAHKQMRGRCSANATSSTSSLSCHGSQCFFATHLILAAVCLQGALLSSILVARTRRVYQMLYGSTAHATSPPFPPPPPPVPD